MKITCESDYALRILRYLGKTGSVTGSRMISESIAVPERFTLKILRKLMMSGFVSSKQGPGGGYSLAVDPDLITVLDVVEAVDGPIMVNRCLSADLGCSLAAKNGGSPDDCYFHHFMCRVNEEIRSRLSKATVAQAIEFEESLPGSAADRMFSDPGEGAPARNEAQAIRKANIL